ncbi:AEC family transporter [Marinilactibacillus sp. Marseille-P9653]|uniref:AEC family transporter n=1 Tax=Marinilactibacillus sp. Marseille-P9653 TaxID=2866583 RepID=UPI001CE48BC7|nr:AEC family transporter [Marinilactibacillus sp. Marseille-P9653]
MASIFLQSFSFLLVVFIAYLFKKAGILRSTDGTILQKIVLNITLPATIIIGFNAVQVDVLLFIMIGLGLFCNIGLILAGGLFWRKKSLPERSMMMFSQGGFNIGNFTIPFVQGLFPAAIPFIGSFDMGNALMLFGGSPMIVDNVLGQEREESSYLKRVLRLFHSPAFTTYSIMLLLALIGITVPTSVTSVVQLFASGNAFLSMFMIGLYLEIEIDKRSLKKIANVLSIRYALVIPIAVGFYFLLPLPELVRLSLVLVLLAPVGTVSTINMIIYGNERSTSSFLSSVSMIVSLVLMTIALTLLA